MNRRIARKIWKKGSGTYPVKRFARCNNCKTSNEACAQNMGCCGNKCSHTKKYVWPSYLFMRAMRTLYACEK